MTITATQLKQANKVFVERDLYYYSDSIKQEIINAQTAVIQADLKQIHSLNNSISNLNDEKELLAKDVARYKSTSKRRAYVIVGESLLIALCLILSI